MSQVLEPAKMTSMSTSVNLLPTRGFAAFGLLLLIEKDPLPSGKGAHGQPGATRLAQD